MRMTRHPLPPKQTAEPSEKTAVEAAPAHTTNAAANSVRNPRQARALEESIEQIKSESRGFWKKASVEEYVPTRLVSMEEDSRGLVAEREIEQLAHEENAALLQREMSPASRREIPKRVGLDDASIELIKQENAANKRTVAYGLENASPMERKPHARQDDIAKILERHGLPPDYRK